MVYAFALTIVLIGIIIYSYLTYINKKKYNIFINLQSGDQIRILNPDHFCEHYIKVTVLDIFLEEKGISVMIDNNVHPFLIPISDICI